MTQDPTPLMKPAEVAERLNIKPHTLTHWRRQGKGPSYVMLGARTVRYPRPLFDLWFDRLTTGGPDEAQ